MERAKRKRRGLRLDDRVVEGLPFKCVAYAVWDLCVENCGVRVYFARKTCVISVRVGRKKIFETIGPVSPDSPYEYLREQAIKRIAQLKRERLPRVATSDERTLRETLEDYIAGHPELSARSIEHYRECIGRGFGMQMDQSIQRLTQEEILRIHNERLEAMAKKDPVNRPPRGYYGWLGTLRTMRAVVSWHCAQKRRINPWPDRRALKIKAPPPRELPVELQSADGRRKLVESLKAIDSQTARACLFLAFTGFRRREGTGLTKVNLLTENVLEFRSKTRVLRVPLSRQALALLDRESDGRLLGVTEHQLRQPLIRIFGERQTSRGRRACVTPHDLRRYFKSVGTELGVDPVVMNLLVGHAIRGVDRSYIAKLRIDVLRRAAQRIADEIDNPTEMMDEDTLLVARVAA